MKLQDMDTGAELCITHGREIKTMAFRGTGFCSINCRKEAGADVSSVGVVMFVTREERDKIMKAREKKAHPKRQVPSPIEDLGSSMGHPGGHYG